MEAYEIWYRVFSVACALVCCVVAIRSYFKEGRITIDFIWAATLAFIIIFQAFIEPEYAWY